MQITQRAIDKIREILADHRAEMRDRNLVPNIAWVNRTGLTSNPGPILGLIEKTKLVGRTFETFSDGTLTIYSCLPEDLELRMREKTLDFVNGDFEFV